MALSEQAKQAKRDRDNARQAKYARLRNEVGSLPPVKEKKLRQKVLRSLQAFYEEIFPQLFCDPFGPVQISSIQHEERILKSGVGLLNKLEPRAYGKSTRSYLGALWAALKGVQPFILLHSDSKEKAQDNLRLIRQALLYNDRLLECFPEVACFRHIEGNPNKARYQTFRGDKTDIILAVDTIRFPRLPGFKSSEALIVATPFRKGRGKNIEGRRPSLVLLDDIQSTEDALSPTTIQKNLKTLRSDIAFLGSRKNPVAIINNATIIASDDFPSQLARNRSFLTVRYKMVESFPGDWLQGRESGEGLWKQYEEIRQEFDTETAGDDLRAKEAARDFYLNNQEAMDKGSKVTWDYAFAPPYQASTIQAAIDYIIDYGLESFYSECQNSPEEFFDLIGSESSILRPADLRGKCNALPRNICPEKTDFVTSFCDISKDVLWYMTVAWIKKHSAGYVIDYGTFPDQSRAYFHLHQLKSTIPKLYRKLPYRAALLRALTEHHEAVLGRTYKSESGKIDFHVSSAAIDSGWSPHTTDVYEFCKRSPFANILRPSKGVGITATKKPLVCEGGKKKKMRANIGGQWTLTPTPYGNLLLSFDTNFHKSNVAAALAADLNVDGCVSFFEADEHTMLADQLTAEFATDVTANGRTVAQWKEKRPGIDNHWLDCLVGNYVQAMLLGMRRPSVRIRKTARTASKSRPSPSPVPTMQPRRKRRRAEVVG